MSKLKPSLFQKPMGIEIVVLADTYTCKLETNIHNVL